MPQFARNGRSDPKTLLRITVREVSHFENALARQMTFYREAHPKVKFEAAPLDLHWELFEKTARSRTIFPGKREVAIERPEDYKRACD